MEPGQTDPTNARSLDVNLKLPLDICEWTGPATLISWIQEELKLVNSGGAPGRQGASDAAGAEANSKLGVLAFAYARGLSDPEEIARLSRSDPLFRGLAGGLAISPADLTEFRRRDRGLLVKLTAQLLTRAASDKLNVPASELPPALKRRLHESAVDRLDNARHMDRGDTV